MAKIIKGGYDFCDICISLQGVPSSVAFVLPLLIGFMNTAGAM